MLMVLLRRHLGRRLTFEHGFCNMPPRSMATKYRSQIRICLSRASTGTFYNQLTCAYHY